MYMFCLALLFLNWILTFGNTRALARTTAAAFTLLLALATLSGFPDLLAVNDESYVREI